MNSQANRVVTSNSKSAKQSTAFIVIELYIVVVVVETLSCVQLFVTPWTAACQAPLSFTISQNLLKFMSVESVILTNHLILCSPFPACLQAFPASGCFSMSQLFASGNQNIGASASAKALPVNIQSWFPLRLTGLICIQSRDSQESLF